MDTETRPRLPVHLKLFQSLSVSSSSRAKDRGAAAANLVFACLRSFCITGGNVCWPSIAEIKRKTGLCENTIAGAFKLLIDIKRIAVDPRKDPFKTTLPDGREVFLDHNYYILFCDTAAYEKFGLFPIALFETETFKKLNVHTKSVLLALYLLAKGYPTHFFLIEELQDEAMMRSREKVLAALDELQKHRFISYKNPCGRNAPYKATRLRVDFLFVPVVHDCHDVFHERMDVVHESTG